VTSLKIDIPDQLFQILEGEAEQREISIDDVVTHYLSSNMILMNKAKHAKEWPNDFFEKTAGCWEGQPLQREQGN